MRKKVRRKSGIMKIGKGNYSRRKGYGRGRYKKNEVIRRRTHKEMKR